MKHSATKCKSHIVKYLIYLFPILFLFSSCSKKDSIKVVDNQENPSYYGTPFQEVPNIEDIVMYEINLRAFSPEGNIQGIIARLDEIKKLGVNVIWIMPIHPIGEINSVNSPYCVKDYNAVSSEYGTMDDLRMLSDEAHARGIALIMDLVANHTSWDNEWITHESFYTHDNSGAIISPPGTNWLDVADLNYGSTDVRKRMLNVMKYWILEANIDGYRCDYADGVPYSFWKSAIDTLRAIPNRKLIFFAEGARADHFTAGFDLAFGWQFYGGLQDVYNGNSVEKLLTAHFDEYFVTPKGKQWVRFTTNHDESAWNNTPMNLFNGKAGALAASVGTIFIGGIPLIYAGQEVGRVDKVPIFSNSTTDWNANPDMLQAYQEILQFYNNSEVARKGENMIFSENDVLCMKKVLNNEELLIIVNYRDIEINYSIPVPLQNSSWTSVFTQNMMSLENEFTLQPYSYFILRK